MTRGNDVAQSTGSTEPRCGRPATSPWPTGHVLEHLQKKCFVYVSSRGGAQGIQCPKVVKGEKLAARPDKWASHMPNLQP
jgi:hypothetical protein